jgi:uncharacterized protein YaiL (DUF2058 family)
MVSQWFLIVFWKEKMRKEEVIEQTRINTNKKNYLRTFDDNTFVNDLFVTNLDETHQ